MHSSESSDALEQLTLLIVDDHPLLRDGLCLSLLSIHPSMNLVCANSLHDATAKLSQRPDIDLVLLDLNLPDGRGLSLLHVIRQMQLFIPCIVFSASEDVADVKAAIRAGASGYIGKSSGTRSILAQISEVLQGQVSLPAFCPSLDVVSGDDLIGQLTPRQKEVLTLMAEGLPNKAICQRLNLTEHTVKSHIKALFQHLNAHTRTECVRIAYRTGLLD